MILAILVILVMCIFVFLILGKLFGREIAIGASIVVFLLSLYFVIKYVGGIKDI
jgi:hypothetical protein